MKEILKKIQESIRENISYISNNNIFISDLKNYIPSGSKYPCVIIYPLNVSNEQQLAHRYYSTLYVRIVIYNRVLELGNALLNDSNGILKLESDIFDLLINNYFGICEITSAFPIAQNSLPEIIDGKDTIIGRELIIKYQKILSC